MSPLTPISSNFCHKMAPKTWGYQSSEPAWASLLVALPPVLAPQNSPLTPALVFSIECPSTQHLPPIAFKNILSNILIPAESQRNQGLLALSCWSMCQPFTVHVTCSQGALCDLCPRSVLARATCWPDHITGI